MQGTRVLPILLALAVAAGFLIQFVSKGGKTAAPAGSEALQDARAFVEAESGLSFRSAPAPVALESDGALAARIESYLDQRFGPSGLARRTRALELLGVLPPGQNLRGQFLAVEATGIRVWFDDLAGILYLAAGFDPSQTPDRAALVSGLSRLLLYQHHGPTSFRSDDEWLAWRGVAGGLGASIEAAYRQSRPGEADLPTSAETEREATLMSLPIYIHGIAQFPVFEGKDFLEIPGARATIVAFPPTSTDPFFREYDRVDDLLEDLQRRHAAARDGDSGPGPPGGASLHPDVANPSLVESLGALGVRLFFERYGDFDQANVLAAHLEHDSYALFSTGSGDHLRWSVRFTDPSDAGHARALLSHWLEDPSPSSDPRFKKIVVDGSNLTLYNDSAPSP